MGADRQPGYLVDFLNPDGRVNPIWYRFLAAIAAQFAGTEAPLELVSHSQLLSTSQPAGAPASVSGRDGDTADLALMAQRIIGKKISSEALDLAAVALRSTGKAASSEALDLAKIALGRVQGRQASPPTQIVICTQATFPALAGTGPTFVYVADFAHWIYWDGTTAGFADGGSNYYTIAPVMPSSVGWHAVDGATVHFLNADGTLTAKTLVNAAGNPAYLKVGAGADTLNAPVAPGLSGSTASGTADIQSGTADIGDDTDAGALLSATAGPTNVALHPHVHVDAGHVHTDAGHTHAKGTLAVDTTGEPENFYSTLWFRL